MISRGTARPTVRGDGIFDIAIWHIMRRYDGNSFLHNNITQGFLPSFPPLKMGCGSSNGAATQPAAQQQTTRAVPKAAPPPTAPPPAVPPKAVRPRLPPRTSTNVVDWEAIKARMPVGRTAAEYDRRTQLFTQFDPNGNGYLSLAEVDKGIREVLQVDEIFDCKPVIMRAFQAARQSRKKQGKPQQADDYVERTEFRMLLVYLRRYFEIWQMFDDVDTSDDRRITLEEFRAAVPTMQQWGVDISNPDGVFQEMDKNKGGSVLFDEFSEWILEQHLLKEVEDEAAPPPAAPPATTAVTTSPSSAAATGAIKPQKTLPPSKDALRTSGQDMAQIKQKLPIESTPADFQRRTELFNRFDPNGNGYLSLSEVDKGIRDVLGLDQVYDCKPVIMRAFQAARAARKKQGKPQQADDYVEKTEFRLLLVYLRRYFEIWEVFEDIDTSSDGRVTKAELSKAQPMLSAVGVPMTDVDATFAAIDTNQGGFILFDEFAAWAVENNYLDDNDAH